MRSGGDGLQPMRGGQSLRDRRLQPMRRGGVQSLRGRCLQPLRGGGVQSLLGVEFLHAVQISPGAEVS